MGDATTRSTHGTKALGIQPALRRKNFFAAGWLAAYFVALGVNTRQSSTELTRGERQMTTKEQDTTEQQRGQGSATVAGDSQAVCRVMVENLFGKRHWAAGWALDLCSADPQFLVHLAEQPRGYAHFLCLIRMALLARGVNNISLQDEARMLRAGNKRKLLKELFPSCPPGIVNLLPKLPKKPLPKDAYQKLIGALEDESVRKNLFHMERIKKSNIFMLNETANFPEQFRSVAMRCVKNVDDYDAFCRTILAAQKFDLKITEQDLIKAFSRPHEMYDEYTDVEYDMHAWLVKKISKLPFPAPPWEGDDRIRPVRSLGELKQVAREFKNCLTCGRTRRNYAACTVAGNCYLYVCEHIPAIVEVRRNVFCGWIVREIEKATVEQKLEIKRKFFRAGISQTWIISESVDDGIPF